jgi:YjbE family integral membrane protein
VDFLWQDITHAPFWIAALQIIGVNIILSGDNAVVIAMACLSLPPRQRLWGMILGAGVAVLLRVVFTLVVAEAMTYPLLKLVGGALLFWVAIKLVSEDADAEAETEAGETLWRAVRIVVIADIVMSLDNVIAIAAAAELAAAAVDPTHAAAIKATLIIFGLATSVPLIIAGSAILMALLERFRVLVWGGGALLGWVAGDIMTSDSVVATVFGEATAGGLHAWGGRLGALIVVCTGLWIVRRRRPFTAEEVWTFVALLVWIAGDIAIGLNLGEDEVAKRWSARLVVFLVLTSDYVVLRSRQVDIVGELVEVEETVVIQSKRERDKV